MHCLGPPPRIAPAPPDSTHGSNTISIKSWMWLFFLTSIPIVNIIAVPILAFTGENETRKNHYKAAILGSAILLFLFHIVIISLGLLPIVYRPLMDILGEIKAAFASA